MLHMLCAIAVVVCAAKLPYTFRASFVEGCSCKDICVTEITGRDAGCHGVGAMHFERGNYGGKSFSGTSAAWAWDSGKWVRLYVEGPSAQRQVLTAFMKAMLADWGKLESVSAARIDVKKQPNGFSATLPALRIIVRPVLGGDGKSAVVHTNLTSPFHSTLMQGETVHAAFTAEHPFTLDKTNGFYNPRYGMSGKI
jgi:hypothetical protein